MSIFNLSRTFFFYVPSSWQSNPDVAGARVRSLPSKVARRFSVKFTRPITLYVILRACVCPQSRDPSPDGSCVSTRDGARPTHARHSAAPTFAEGP